jgi:hypothetical protein
VSKADQTRAALHKWRHGWLASTNMNRARKQPRLAWRTLPRSGVAAAQMVMTSLAGVCDQAASITRGIPHDAWEAFMVSDRVYRDGRPDQYYTFIRQADRLQSMGPDELTQVLSRGRDQDGVDLVTGLDLLSAEGPEATLRVWRLKEAHVRHVLNSRVGLTYHRLHTVLAEAEPLAQCDKTERTFFAMVAAVLLTPSLERTSD